jgi:hypothetical protein
MYKNATKCNKTQNKWCINKHGASKIIDTFETYHTQGGETIVGVTREEQEEGSTMTRTMRMTWLPEELGR